MKRRRVFIAIAIPPDIQKKLFQATQVWRDSELPIRWTPQYNIHITLLFIGSVDDEELSRIAAALSLVVEEMESFDISLDRIGFGPNEKNPRMVWAGGEHVPELPELQKRVSEAIFEGGGRYAAESEYGDSDNVLAGQKSSVKRQMFKLHVTLGRMIPFSWKSLGRDAPKIDKVLNVSFPVTGIELMESELGLKGPVYTVLSSAEFAG